MLLVEPLVSIRHFQKLNSVEHELCIIYSSFFCSWKQRNAAAVPGSELTVGRTWSVETRWARQARPWLICHWQLNVYASALTPTADTEKVQTKTPDICEPQRPDAIRKKNWDQNKPWSTRWVHWLPSSHQIKQLPLPLTGDKDVKVRTIKGEAKYLEDHNTGKFFCPGMVSVRRF